jgi:hypothetical protein
MRGMSGLDDALRAGLAPAPAQPGGALGNAARGHGLAAHRAVVVGGVGPLGGLVLAQLLAGGGFARVAAPVQQPVAVALRGFEAWPFSGLQHPPAAGQRAEVAVVVFDREHRQHGRELAFVRPRPDALPALGRWLLAAGVRRLVLVMPQAPTLLPQALRAGLANLDEQALTALGFEQLVIVRPARALGPAAGPPQASAQRAGPGPSAVPNGLLHRVARGLLAQLVWMVPQRDQPLRARRVAQFVTALVRALPAAGPGTRVAPPELLWDWAQPQGGDAVLAQWLLDGQWAPVVSAGRRW